MPKIFLQNLVLSTSCFWRVLLSPSAESFHFSASLTKENERCAYFCQVSLHFFKCQVVQGIQLNEVLARSMSFHGFTVGAIKSFGHPSLWALAHDQVLPHQMTSLLPCPFRCCIDPRVQKVCGVSRSSCFYHSIFFYYYYKHKLEN